MGASGYVAYVAKHGYHFTKQLAIKASEQMKNVDGTSHRWTVEEIRLATNNEIISKGTTSGIFSIWLIWLMRTSTRR